MGKMFVNILLTKQVEKCIYFKIMSCITSKPVNNL